MGCTSSIAVRVLLCESRRSEGDRMTPHAWPAEVSRAAPSFWLCPRGTRKDPLPGNWYGHADWRRENTHWYATGRPGKPKLVPGDQIVWYAVKHRVMYGLAEVLDEPVDKIVRPWQSDEDWNWFIKTRTSVVIPDLTSAPTLELAGLQAGSVRSYRSLTKDGFARCVLLIRSIGKPYNGE
jgi:hypothetical protein